MRCLPRIETIKSILAAGMLALLGASANAQSPAEGARMARADHFPIMAAFGLAIPAGLVLYRRRRPERAYRSEPATEPAEPRRQHIPSSTMKMVRDGIDDDFSAWNLSSAERDVAWFMLRGLPLKEIAALRGTSERTVRQQAQSIYRKADLEGRSDLAGRVLERFI